MYLCKTKMSKENVITKLIPVFRQYGYEGTTLSMLSKASGLGKASLYHYFPNGKEEMIVAVFNYVGENFNQLILQPLKKSEEPHARIMAMGEGLQTFYGQGKNACFLAILSFGEANNLFPEQLKQQLQLWIDLLAKALTDAGIEPKLAIERSQDTILAIQGALVLGRILNNTEAFQKVINNLPQKLLSNNANP